MPENRESQGREKGSQHRFISAGELKVANFFFETAKSQNIHKRCHISRLLGAEIAKNLEMLILATISLYMDESEGDFREVAFCVFQNLQKTQAEHTHFSLPARPRNLHFLPPLVGYFKISAFSGSAISKISKKASEGWQKVRVL